MLNQTTVIGQSGLMAGRSQLDNTAQNVANTLTEWYTRRVGIMTAAQTRNSDSGLPLLKGVRADQFQWLTDTFVTSRVWYTSGQYEQAKVLDTYLHQLDNILGGEHTGYSEPLNQLQRSLQRASATPESIALRQQVLADAGSVAQRLVTLQRRFEAFHTQMEEQVQGAVVQVNQLAESVAHFNGQIRQISQAGGDVSDLWDQRNKTIHQLCETESGASVYLERDKQQ